MTKERKETPKQNKPAVLLLDIETSKIVAKTFTLYPESISHNDIIQDWYIICASWKWLGESRVYNEKTYKPTEDKKVVESLAAAIKQADIIVAHNGKKFDMKKFVSRLVYHKLPPVPYIPVVDTLVEIKKVAQHTSHRLDYLDKFLGGVGKVDTEPGLWDRAMLGVKSAVDKMAIYCNGDINALERVYTTYRPYFKSHPHVSVIQGGEKCDCPRCGSVNVTNRGFTFTAAGNKNQRRQCNDCGGWHTIPLKIVK